MTIDYQVKPKNIEFLRIAIDFLLKHEKTSRVDVKSIRVLDYYWSPGEYLNVIRDSHRFKIQFEVNGDSHNAIIIIYNSSALLGARNEVVYAMLDSYYDLILNKELVEIILKP